MNAQPPRSLEALATACDGPYGDLIMVLGLEGEVAGLQVGDRVSVPGPGLRLSRAVLCKQRWRCSLRRHVEESPGANGPAG